jgi:hypothetical protein
MKKIILPSIRETAFNCPHCHVLTTQYWYKVLAKQIVGKVPLPFIPNEEMRNSISQNPEKVDPEKRKLLKYIDRLMSGLVLMNEQSEYEYVNMVDNLHLTVCYNCKKVAVWVYDRLMFPNIKIGPEPNQDLQAEIIHDFDEAREIVNASPRGAAALLRLCIQKLCKHLGEKGKNIDDDIASLVKKGLNPIVQKSLDIVRVIGNEAVHPGVIDLKDDRDTALQLFDLLNAIADQMISHPKAVNEMYAKLPEAKRKAIADRDKK